MNFGDLERCRKNEKVHGMIRTIFEVCEEKGYTISDMNDLAWLLPEEINKAIKSEEETTIFRCAQTQK